MIKASILIAALYLPATAGEPIRIYLDGQPVGTLAELEYRIGAEIHITTWETVRGCRLDLIFADRLED